MLDVFSTKKCIEPLIACATIAKGEVGKPFKLVFEYADCKGLQPIQNVETLIKLQYFEA